MGAFFDVKYKLRQQFLFQNLGWRVVSLDLRQLNHEGLGRYILPDVKYKVDTHIACKTKKIHFKTWVSIKSWKFWDILADVKYKVQTKNSIPVPGVCKTKKSISKPGLEGCEVWSYIIINYENAGLFCLTSNTCF